MKALIVICLVVLFLLCSIDARWRFRRAPRVRVVRVRSCSRQCHTAPGICYPGGCAQYGTQAQTTCVRHQTQSLCTQYGSGSTRVCVSENARCRRWNYVNQKVCKRYTTVRVPINKLVNGPCAETGTRCALTQTIPKAVCARYGTKCVNPQPITRKVCVRREKTKCLKRKTVTSSFCKQVGRKCAAVKEINVPTCEKYSTHCASVSTEDLDKSSKCGTFTCQKKQKVCLKKRKFSYSTCAAYKRTNKCRKYAERNTAVCTKRKTVCLKSKSVKYRVCASRRRSCRKYITQRLGTKCAQTRYRIKKNRKCAKWTTVGAPIGKCIPVSKAKRVCIRRRGKKCIKFGYARKTKRVCAKYRVSVTRTAYCAKRVPIVKKVCVKYSRPCNRYVTKSKKVCTKRGSKCTCSKTIKKKYCAMFARTCSRRVRRVGYKCSKWGERCVKRPENKVTKCAAVTKYCSASGFLKKKTCAKWENVCKKRETRRRSVCVQRASVGKCLEWKDFTGVTCSKTTKVCEQYKTENQSFCARHGTYCKRPSKVWKVVGYKHVSKCANWATVRKRVSCAQYSKNCNKWVTKRTGVICKRSATRNICVAQQTSYTRTCTRHAPGRCTRGHTQCNHVCQDRFVTIRGDVHLMVGSKFVDFNYAGVFDYFALGTCSAQIRLEQRKAATVLTGLAVQCENDKFVASTDEVSLNGKEITEATTKFGDKGQVNKLGDGKFEFKSGFGFDLQLDVESKLNVLGVRFHESAEAAQHFKASGLMKKGSVQFAKDYVVPEKLSLFKRYVKFGHAKAVAAATDADKKKGEELCAKLKDRSKAFEQCVYDYVATGQDWSDAYKLKQ